MNADLPILLALEPVSGQVQSVVDPQVTAGLGDLEAALPAEDRAAFRASLAAALGRPLARFQIDARLVRPSGQFVPVLVHGSTMATAAGGATRVLLVITDNSSHVAMAERFELATAAASEVIFLLDFDTNRHWWSKAFARQFGHQPFQGSDAVARWFDLVHPADKPRIKASHARARDGGAEDWQDEYRFRKADGSYARVIDRAKFFRRPDGSIARSVSTLTDVTQLHEVTELFRHTVEAAQDVIYSHDLKAGTLWLNEAFKGRYGHDPAPYADHPEAWVDLILPADRPGFLIACEQALHAANRLELTYRLRRADGRYCAVIDRAQILRNEAGRAVRIVGSVVDVTAVRQEEERSRALVEVAANAVYDYDVAADTFYYSEGMEKTFGHNWIGPQPAMVLWVDLLHPDERAGVEAAFLRFLAGRDRYARLEYRFKRADGTWAHVRERMIVLRDDEGRAIKVIGGIEDITAEHDTQERLHHSQKMEAIGRLTGGVAHDFNNLLTVIIGSAGLMEAEADLSPAQRDLIRNVGLAARRGAELTSGLLSFARQQPLTPATLNMAAVFAEMDALLRRTLPAFITLDTAQAADLWLVEADPTQLNTALLNLCVNAADAMPEGGRIRLECRNWAQGAPGGGQDDPDMPQGDYLRLDITDTGHGMSPEVLARAFDPFFTTKPMGKGSGLGLSMVWGFAKQSGGHATIASQVGIGTTVTMFLPRSPKATAEVEPAARAEMVQGQGQHVLVVEDDRMVRKLVVALVQRLRYRVSEAENGDEALEILRKTPDIDLLFTDMVMPGRMSGTELAERALQEFPRLLVLFTSGYSENAIIHDGRLDEGVQFLAKPYQLRDLGEKLRAVFAARVLRRRGGVFEALDGVTRRN